MPKKSKQTQSKQTLREELDNATDSATVVQTPEETKDCAMYLAQDGGGGGSIRFVNPDGLSGFLYSELSHWILNSSGTDIEFNFQSHQVLVSGSGLELVEDQLADLRVSKLVAGEDAGGIKITSITFFQPEKEED